MVCAAIILVCRVLTRADELPSIRALPPDTARTRRLILAAASRLIAKGGLGVSIGGIAAAVGVSRSGLLHHFSSISILFEALTRGIFDEIRSIVYEQVDLTENQPGKLLRAYVRAMCDEAEWFVSEQSQDELHLDWGAWVVVRSSTSTAAIESADARRWDAELSADGLDKDRVLLVRLAADGLSSLSQQDEALARSYLERMRTLVDSLNLSTIWVVVAIILLARRPAATSWTFAAGAFASFVAGVLIFYFAAGTAATMLFGLTLWLRRIVFALIVIFLVVLAIRRLKTRPQHQFKLPSWVNPWSGLPIGALATVADLLNGFPMFLAVERIINAEVPSSTGVLLLMGYSVIYILPTLAVLILGIAFGQRSRDRIQRIYNRYALGEAKASWKLAAFYLAGAIGTTALLIFVIW